MSISTETIPEFTRGDLIVRGQAEETYRYPFLPIQGDSCYGYEPLTIAEVGKIDRYARLHGLSVQKNSRGVSFLSEQGFDLAEVVSKQGGVVLEVGGPTIGGYQTLADVDLPKRPIITNRASAIGPARPGKVKDLAEVDKITIDFLSEARKLPLADNSVDLMMASCLNYITDNNCTMEEVSPKKQALYESAILKVLAGKRVIEESSDSPRIAFLLEAQRLVKEGGIVIIRGVDPLDITLANSLGFVLRSRTLSSREGQDDADNAPYIAVGREVVLEKISSMPVSGKMEKLPPPIKGSVYKKFLGKIGVSF